MSNQNLIIYRFSSLYHTLKELEKDLNFKVFEATNEKNLNNLVLTLQNHLIVTSKEISNKNQYIINKLPIKFSKLVENINIKILKNKFVHQSKIEIKNYLIDLNSREISLNDISLKLTEKEINIILYLSKFDKSLSINKKELYICKKL